MLFKPWHNNYICVNLGILVLSWKSVLLFENNVRIIGYAWLPNLPVHLLSFSSPTMRDNNGTKRIPRYCCPNLHRTSPAFRCWNQAFQIDGSRNIKPSCCTEDRENPYHSFTVVGRPCFTAVTLPFTYLSTAFSNEGFSICSIIVVVGFVKLKSDIFFETGSSKWIFRSAVTCAAVVMWFFERILFNIRRSLRFNLYHTCSS